MVYLLFLIFLCHLLNVIDSFIPEGRVGHSAALVGNMIYFFGGRLTNFEFSNEVFLLDLSQPFDTFAPPWVDLSYSASVPFLSFDATTSVIDDNIYLIGGYMFDLIIKEEIFASSVYTFNINSMQWTPIAIKGIMPQRRGLMNSVSDQAGKIYAFGGYDYPNNQNNSTKVFNDMIILDTTDSIWSYGTKTNSPLPRYYYTATILSDGVIVYIGGYEVVGCELCFQIVDIYQIILYDTKTDSWTKMEAGGVENIDPRYSHTAVLDSNNTIIVYGGKNSVNQNSSPSLIVLNVYVQPYEWIIPSTNGNYTPPPLADHSAFIVEDYMILTLGNLTISDENTSEIPNTNVYLLDLRAFMWVNSFNSSNSSSTITTSVQISETTSPDSNYSSNANYHLNSFDGYEQITTLK
ncbi:11081_t:CDS:2 [Funneliformis geosporum]|uniref:11081_t:CDS:1 n=1 Tax=Funneliformis geosporum TaxID=1117311 RepID=A0A9W4WJU2_9GLOM|nr:11081_t:CDS:2 [Funneliformis geosporum]